MTLLFGEFRLDVAARRIWNGSAEIMLAPKAFDLLAYLAQRPGHVCSRDELFAALWPNTFVDDHALSVQIADVRRALGDSPKTPQFIETRSRRGYCFVAGVDGAGPSANGITTAAAPRLAPIPPPPIPETHYATSGDVNIAYQVFGAGPVDLVFVMGWVSHLEYFWREPRFAAFLRRLGTLARVILFDKRGTGLSDRVPLSQLPTLEQRMDDVRAVMEAAGSTRAVLYGVSEGGPLCTLFAATYPEKTLGLIMIGSYARRLRDADYPWGPTREDRDEYCRYIRQNWGGPVGIEDRAPTLANDPAFRDWWATYLRMGASPGAAEALTRMNADIDVRPILTSIRTRTLVLHRRDDRCLLAEEGKLMAARIPGAQFVELSGADHLPFVGDQEELFAEIELFLSASAHYIEPARALATILCVDIPEPDLGRMQIHLRREIGWFRGRPGDLGTGAPLATFDGPARAIRCAHSIVIHAGGIGVRLRASLHTGECEFDQRGIPAGSAVEVAGRLLPQSPLGGVVVSRVVKDLVAGSGIRFSASRNLNVPGHREPWELFEVVGC
ncbi:MAG: alpha/beta fold hydrolase [Acidobacteria bacterium]|nr:alpha/beta fold hydrolase [Acidobacteriota bacterium]